MIYKIQFFVKMYAEKYSDKSFINCIVAYLDNWQIYIFILREQPVLGFTCIDANFI